MDHQWKVICNPKSAGGRASRDWPLLQKLLRHHGIQTHCDFSKYKYHAIDLARKAYEAGYRQFIIVGRDGSFHEVVNGIASVGMHALDQSRLAIIPVGKGNDWARTHHIPKKYAEAVRTIARGNSSRQDLGRITYMSTTGFSNSRFFINMAGIGFDACVARAIGERFERGSRLSTLSYSRQMMLSLFSYKSQPASISLNGIKLNTRLFTLAASIGKFNGGGLKQCPQAVTDDGLLDITAIDHVSIPTVLSNIHRLLNGRFVKLAQVSQHRTNAISIDGDHPLPVEADGEVLGNTPASLRIFRKRLSIVIP